MHMIAVVYGRTDSENKPLPAYIEYEGSADDIPSPFASLEFIYETIMGSIIPQDHIKYVVESQRMIGFFPPSGLSISIAFFH